MFIPDPPPVAASDLPGYISSHFQKIAEALRGYDIREYVPIWTGASSNPVLGNGSLRGCYRLTNDVCELWLRLLAGGTTTFGTGEWRFSLPRGAMPAKIDQIGEALMLDSGTTRVVGACKANAGGNLLRVYAQGNLNGVQSNVPFTWATNDELWAHIRYFR